MSDGWTAGKEKTAPRKRSEWLIDSGLVFIYSLFIMACFFIFIVPRVLGGVRSTGWGDWISIFLVILISPCISFILHSLRRTVAIFFSSSLLGFVLTSATSVAFLFDSYSSHSIEIGPDNTIRFSPAQQILVFMIGIFFLSILGAIVGDYIAERTRRGERRLTLRCSNCGTWNEQDVTSCSHCGKKLNTGTKKKTESKAERSSPSS